MIKSNGSIEISRPIHEVYDYTLNNVAEWSLTVVSETPIDVKPDNGVGTTYRCVTEDRGQRMTFEGIVTKSEPPTLSVSELTGTSFDIEVAYGFEDLGDSTRVTQVSIVRPKSFFLKFFLKFFAGMATKGGCDATQKELVSLKQHMEGQDEDSHE